MVTNASTRRPACFAASLKRRCASEQGAVQKKSKCSRDKRRFSSQLQSITNDGWEWESAEFNQKCNLWIHKSDFQKLWIHKISNWKVVDPHFQNYVFFKFCLSTIFWLGILWIHNFLKSDLWIHKIQIDNLKASKITSPKTPWYRGECCPFFFLHFGNSTVFFGIF